MIRSGAAVRGGFGCAPSSFLACCCTRASPQRRRCQPRLAGTEVFTGGGEALRPRDKPAKPVTTYWRVQLFVKMANAPAGAHAQVLLPLSDAHQEILGRQLDADGFIYREEPDAPNLWGHWTRTATGGGPAQIEYELNVAVTDTGAAIPARSLGRRSAFRRSCTVYLQPSALVQSGDPDVKRRARDLVKDARTVEDAAWALFQYTAAFVRTGGRRGEGGCAHRAAAGARQQLREGAPADGAAAQPRCSGACRRRPEARGCHEEARDHLVGGGLSRRDRGCRSIPAAATSVGCRISTWPCTAAICR